MPKLKKRIQDRALVNGRKTACLYVRNEEQRRPYGRLQSPVRKGRYRDSNFLTTGQFLKQEISETLGRARSQGALWQEKCGASRERVTSVTREK